MSERLVVLVTVDSAESAERIAKAVLDRKLAACVNILPQIRSIYRWEGKICDDSELLLLIKTRTELFEGLKAAVIAEHPYSVPEVIALPIVDGSAPYLKWLDDSTSTFPPAP